MPQTLDHGETNVGRKRRGRGGSMLTIRLIYLETEAMFKVHSCTNHPDVTPEIQRQ